MSIQTPFNYQQEIDVLRSHFGFDLVSVALVQTAQHRFEHRWVYASGNLSDRYKRIVLQSGKGILGNVVKTGKEKLVLDVSSCYPSEELFNYPIITAEKLSSFGAIPLYKQHRVQGVLLVACRGNKFMTRALFQEVKQFIGVQFGPYSIKEVVDL